MGIATDMNSFEDSITFPECDVFARITHIAAITGVPGLLWNTYASHHLPRRRDLFVLYLDLLLAIYVLTDSLHTPIREVKKHSFTKVHVCQKVNSQS